MAKWIPALSKCSAGTVWINFINDWYAKIWRWKKLFFGFLSTWWNDKSQSMLQQNTELFSNFCFGEFWLFLILVFLPKLQNFSDCLQIWYNDEERHRNRVFFSNFEFSEFLDFLEIWHNIGLIIILIFHFWWCPLLGWFYLLPWRPGHGLYNNTWKGENEIIREKSYLII